MRIAGFYRWSARTQFYPPARDFRFFAIGRIRRYSTASIRQEKTTYQPAGPKNCHSLTESAKRRIPAVYAYRSIFAHRRVVAHSQRRLQRPGYARCKATIGVPTAIGIPLFVRNDKGQPNVGITTSAECGDSTVGLAANAERPTLDRLESRSHFQKLCWLQWGRFSNLSGLIYIPAHNQSVRRFRSVRAKSTGPA